MTKSELRSRLKQMLGNRSGGALTDAWYDDRVLSGYRRLLTFQGLVTGPANLAPTFRVLDFPQHRGRLTRSLTTSLTSNFVPNQAGALAVVDLYNRDDNVGLQRTSERDILMRDPDELGVPTHWTPAGEGGVTGYYIWPRPGVAADNRNVYEYVITDASLPTDASSPAIPEEWHLAILFGAGIEAAALLDWPEKEAEMSHRFKDYIAERVTTWERVAHGGRSSRRRNIYVGDW